MISFTIKLENFLKLDTKDKINFSENKKNLMIPPYQREYKWEDEKVLGLLQDIRTRDKFLGIVILDEKTNHYEIVDGQQRITTIFLTLVALYNYYQDSFMEQKTVRDLLMIDDKFFLYNGSLGDFLKCDSNFINILIDPKDDIYHQEERLKNTYSIINGFVNSLSTENGCISDFRNKLLDSEFLILINNEYNNTSPIEQVFLDINEKSQLLEVEDIFKGYCFKIFNSNYYEELKALWVKLKQVGINFQELFSYENLSSYLYLFLLYHVSKEITSKLLIDGKHYLENKTADQTKKCLTDMIAYGEKIILFYNNINKNDYKFEDICPKTKNNIGDVNILKKMSLEILTFDNALYQKLPFMELINCLISNKQKLEHAQFRKVVCNLYIYSFIFISCYSKSKSNIDTSINQATNKKGKDLVEVAKELRKSSVLKMRNLDLTKLKKFDYKKHSFIYSIIDNYNSSDNWISKIYEKSSYNQEHFIIPKTYNLGLQVKIFNNKGEPKEIILKDILKESCNDLKELFVNSLILPEELNRQIERYDICTKIELIKQYYKKDQIPKHITFFINKIESLSSYQNLKNILNTKGAIEQNIIFNYKNFISEYFSEVSINQTENDLIQSFIETFK